jgi:serine/threonine-protein kinase
VDLRRLEDSDTEITPLPMLMAIQHRDPSLESFLSPTAVTRRRTLLGSPHYMSPEQWSEAADVDHRADLYALTILTYEVLTGRPPFLASSMADLALQHCQSPLPRLPASFPAALDDVLARGAAKEPDDRFASASELAAALRQAAGPTARGRR